MRVGVGLVLVVDQHVLQHASRHVEQLRHQISYNVCLEKCSITAEQLFMYSGLDRPLFDYDNLSFCNLKLLSIRV